ncbi:MAG TPA: asparagine synthase-related protein [Candidatus Acidoferrum sp.]|nr:asparagine synthase-related protein [Candidatus Acidoferrum sp.]
MSGFFGMVRTDGNPVEPRFLEQVAEGLRFRGPDGSHTWQKEGFGTCFSYLETGTRHQSCSQPVRLGERYTLLGEVRLDERKDLSRGLLEKKLPVTVESSDEDLVLHAWSVWGADTPAKLLGDFSFAIFDASEQLLFCARDFAGARPFFYAWREGVFCFSNTLKVLRIAPGVSAALDDLFVRDFLLTGYCGDPARTVWRDVRRLPAGHRLILSGGQVEVQRFLRLPIEEPLRFKHAGEYLENYRELLGQAVADRLPEKKVSLYLSGGLDSGSVCAATARITRENGNSPAPKAFTTSWRPLFDDPEPDFALLTAHHLGLVHEIFQEDTFRPDARYAANAPEPAAEFFLDRDLRFFQAISAHAPVVLSGDGGDDILSGQAWPYLKYLFKRGEWSEIARSYGGYLISRKRFPPLRGGFRSRFRRWFGRQGAAQPLPEWFNQDFARRVQDESEGRFQERPPLERHPLHPDAYASLHSGYWAMILEFEDAGSTRINLETRAPLLDLRILKFLLRLPPVPWCANKELSRRAMKGDLPEAILLRAKTPLLEEPLEACRVRAGWRPNPGMNPPKMVREYVQWERWLATFENPEVYFRYEYLSGLSLSSWLKAIENEGGIK